MMANRSVFLHKFFDAPTKIGSVTPSSRFLTQKMLGELPWDEMESIVELGAGTGVFTEYIAQHKKESCKAVIIEQDTFMLRELEHRFPELLYGSQAENLPFILQKFGLEKVDCIISGLPFAIFTKELRMQILCGASGSLKENGQFIAFQYSPQMYFSFWKCFSRIRLGFELRNFPPAFVYRCQKGDKSCILLK